MANEETPAPETGGLAATSFFSKTYDEASALLLETRDYMAGASILHWERPIVGLIHSRETTRITARVLHMMAWLMIQRAVHAGEIPPEAAAEERHRLAGREVCLDAGAENAPAMPDRLRDLLARSWRLYQRIARLDEMIARDRANGADRGG